MGYERCLVAAETPERRQGNLTRGLCAEARHKLHRLEDYTFPCQAESAREVGLDRQQESVLCSTRLCRIIRRSHEGLAIGNILANINGYNPIAICLPISYNRRETQTR